MFDESLETLDESVETTSENQEKMPSLKHSYICSGILRQLFADEQLQVLPELTLNIEKGLTPDISVYDKDTIQIEPFDDYVKYDRMPILAIEIISPSQNVQQLREKSKLMKNHGIQAIWTVEPYTRSVLVNDANGEHLFREESVESANIRVDFARVFR